MVLIKIFISNPSGIIPRAIEQVGQYKETLEHDGWSYSMQVSFVEIYNEVIRDLLREEDDPSLDLKHEIKVNPDGRRYITNVHMVPLDPCGKFDCVLIDHCSLK